MVGHQFCAWCLASISHAEEKEDLHSAENGILVHPRKWIDKTIIANV